MSAAGYGDDRAADYVLGLLDEAEAAAFEHAVQADPGLAREVADWRERLAELDETAPPLAPGADLWHRIERNLPPHGASAAASSRSGRARTALWDSLAFWRMTGLAATAAALVLALGLAALVQRPVPGPRMIAVLIAEGETSPGAIVEVDADGAARLITLADIPVPAGRALQVWTLPSPETGPVSIGLLDAARSISLDTESLPPAAPNQLFEITLEPASGSPTGRPTGPILFKGLASEAL